jgi:hypothetical protein
LMKLRNAGIFAPKNKQHLYDALGVDVPQDIADGLNEIIRDYERNTKQTGNLSNVEAEEVVRAITNLIEPLDKSSMEKAMGVLGDYMALRASSTIATAFNAAQNITSGINSSVLSTITAITRTGNPKLALRFLTGWGQAFYDVARGGVTIRDARTINALEQLQGRGGLSDRWTFDNAKGFFGYIKASLNALAQVTATAADAANGTVVYHAGMVTAVKAVLKSRGMTGKEANKAIDDIIFGKDQQSGKTYRQIWYEEALNRLETQEGVVARGSKAKRIADELIWHKLITDYHLTIEEVKAMQSASLEQKSKNLGHQSDVLLSPSTLIEAANHWMLKKAEEEKEHNNMGKYAGWQASAHLFRTMNMFVGGKANWAILTLQNSPVGVAFGLFDIVLKEARRKGTTPLYRQELSKNDPELLRKQLAERKGIQGRLERGIYGSAIQYLLYAGVMMLADAGGDDEEETNNKLKRVFDPMMNDPNTKRMLDKALPMMLASELTYAFDKKTKKLDPQKLSKTFWLPKYDQSVMDFFKNVNTQVVGEASFDRLNENIGYAERIKDKEARNESITEQLSMYAGGLLQVPYTSWYNIEKKEMKVFANSFNPDPLESARVRAEWKKHMANLDGATDAFLKGMITPQIHEQIVGLKTNKNAISQ